MKKLFLAVAFACAPLAALGQTLPSPAFQALTLSTPLPASSGGTGGNTAATARTSLGAAASGANGDITGLSDLGAGILNIEATNTSSAANGFVLNADPLWNPPGAASSTAQLNDYYWLQNIQSISLNSGSVQERWDTTLFPNAVNYVVSGPTGTPTAPSGSADSHTIGYFAYGSVPAGLCDGQNGNGFTGAGGSPGNDCYQELGGFDTQLTSLSPGYYLEGMSSQEMDTEFGTGTAVPTRMTGFTAGIYKNNAANTYTSYGFISNSSGTQQTTYAPTDAFVVNGGWQNGLDLSSGTYNNAAILFPNSQSVVSASGVLNINLGASALAIGGHIAFSSTTAPTLTGCTGCSLDSTASDVAGDATEGTSQTGFVLTFNVPFSTKPHCGVYPDTSLANAAFTSKTETTTTLTVVNGALTSTGYSYICAQ